MKYLEQVIMTVLDNEAWTGTKYVSPRLVVRATQRRYLRHPKMGLGTRANADLVVHMGRPNYKERELIKMLKRAKVPFPVRRVQLRFIPEFKKIAKKRW